MKYNENNIEGVRFKVGSNIYTVKKSTKESGNYDLHRENSTLISYNYQATSIINSLNAGVSWIPIESQVDNYEII